MTIETHFPPQVSSPTNSETFFLTLDSWIQVFSSASGPDCLFIFLRASWASTFYGVVPPSKAHVPSSFSHSSPQHLLANSPLLPNLCPSLLSNNLTAITCWTAGEWTVPCCCFVLLSVSKHEDLKMLTTHPFGGKIKTSDIGEGEMYKACPRGGMYHFHWRFN